MQLGSIEIVETSKNLEDQRKTGKGVEQQENVFQILVETRMLLEPILTDACNLPMLDADQFINKAKCQLDAQQLDQIEKLLQQQSDSIKSQLNLNSANPDDQFYQDIQKYHNQFMQLNSNVNQTIQQQINNQFSDKLKLYKRVFQQNDSNAVIGEQLDFCFEAQTDIEKQEVKQQQQPYFVSDKNLDKIYDEQTLKQADNSNILQRKKYQQLQSYNQFNDADFYGKLLESQLQKNSTVELLQELKHSKQKLHKKGVGMNQKKDQLDNIGNYKFKKLEKFCVPQQRQNNEYLDLVRGALFGVK